MSGKLAATIAASIVIPAALLAGSLLLLTGRAPGRAPAVARPVPPPPRVQTFVFGVREHATPGPWTSISRFAEVTGVTPRLVLYYSNWREPFQSRFAATAAEHGASLLVQIQPWSAPLQAIAAGHDDGYLRAFARQVRAFRRPVVIGFAHEMNGHWYPWGYGRQPASAFVAAWRHLVTVFRLQGARNVRWLWTISSNAPLKHSLHAYWPGARYVTWIGIDGYYESRGQDFKHVFGPIIRHVRKLTSDPILLSETAIGPAAGQARMMPDLFAGIREYHVRGLVWFDVAQQGGLAYQDWRLEGHPAAAAAFRTQARKLWRTLARHRGASAGPGLR